MRRETVPDGLKPHWARDINKSATAVPRCSVLWTKPNLITV